ncbi:MAG TPA: alpha-isopropylmalate synthase regulatory domain-containing protein [Sphingomicrobium sp.]|nr:alpha-isopropylmalate synthase regulatory domain-containing protein [Sphingomicrobium sp.]
MTDSATKTEREIARPDVRHWHLRRIDIRSPVMKDAWPVARIELEHPARGRVSDIGTAPGAFDAAFVAAGQIVGIHPHLLSYNVRSGPPAEKGALPITIDVEIELGGKVLAGSSSGVDLVRCSLEAWLDAIAKSAE